MTSDEANRKAQREMLAAERRNRARLAAVIGAVLLLHGRSSDASPAKVAFAGVTLYQPLLDAMSAIRSDAARTGINAAARDIGALGAKLGVTIDPVVPRRADVVARGLAIDAGGSGVPADGIVRRLVGLFTRSAADGGTLRSGARAAASRLDTIAATETAAEFNLARAETVAQTVRANASEAWVSSLYRVWDATLDRRTCPTCEALDGSMVPAAEDFPGGQRPGRVHSRCRCTESIAVVQTKRRP